MSMKTKTSKAKQIEAIAASTLETLETVEKNIKQNNKNGKKDCNSIKCKYAKMFQQKGTAHTTFTEGELVYVIKKDDKYVAYGQCSFNHVIGKDFCSRHEKQAPAKRIIFDSLVNNQDGNVEQIKTVKHPYFNGMGTRGAPKNIDEGDIYKFSCTDHPILKLLRDSNKSYTLWLIQCAIAIRDTGKPIITNNGSTTYTIQQKNSDSISSSLLSLMNDEEEENKMVSKKKPTAIDVEQDSDNETTKKVESDDDESDDDESVDNESDDDKSDDDESDDDESDGTKSISSEEDDQEEVTLVPIETHKGQKYFVNPDSLTAYEFPSEDDEDQKPSELGILIEITKKYSTLTYDDKHYIISKEVNDESKNLDMYYCVLSDKVFDKETKSCLGKLKRGKKGISISYREDK